jgi:hypothetical protein
VRCVVSLDFCDFLLFALLCNSVPYVGEVDSTTQCLFLLVVDTTSLVILAYSKPYQNSRDDFLSLVLGEPRDCLDCANYIWYTILYNIFNLLVFMAVTTECAAFLMGVVVISGKLNRTMLPFKNLYWHIAVLYIVIMSFIRY